MIIAYHAIFTTYGTWLPNDPRGSYSREIYSAELRALGTGKYGWQFPQPDQNIIRRFHVAARPRLSRQPVLVTSASRDLIARSFAKVAARLQLDVVACAIMPNHVHLLLMRTTYRIEYLVNQFKGAATRALDLKQTPWTRGCWKVFIDDDEALLAAALYIEANPVAARLKP